MSIWYLQGVGGTTRELDFYPSVEEIFTELSRQSNTRLDTPPLAKIFDQPMIKPLTDTSKEEDYGICVQLNTLIIDHDHTGDLNPLGIALTAT